MKRIFYSICIVLSCVILNSCSSDEDPPTEEMMEQVEEDEPPFEESEPPSDFVIVVDSVGFDMASVTWTKPVGDNNNDLLYTVLLNGDIIAEDFTEREYSFSNLEFNTVYTLAVIAENTGGMSEAQTDFETLNPDNYSFLLRTFYRDDNYLRYEYQGNKVKRRTFGDEDLSFFTHEVNYNTNGKIASSFFEHDYVFEQGGANYSYDNNGGFEEINTWVYDGEGYDIDFTFSSEDTYEVLYSIGLYENLSAVTLKRDAQGRIIEYQRIDLDTQETKILQFEYANGNMVTINEVSEDILWTIEYDDKKSFYVPGIYQQTNLVFGRDFDYFLGFPELRVYFWKEIKKIPEFITYKNQNNPLQIYKNGNLSWTFDYEYNSLGYPVKVFQGTMDPFILEYIRFEL